MTENFPYNYLCKVSDCEILYNITGTCTLLCCDTGASIFAASYRPDYILVQLYNIIDIK